MCVKVSHLGSEDPGSTVQVSLSLEQGLYHSVLCVMISMLNTGLVGFPRLAISDWITTLNNTNNRFCPVPNYLEQELLMTLQHNW